MEASTLIFVYYFALKYGMHLRRLVWKQGRMGGGGHSFEGWGLIELQALLRGHPFKGGGLIRGITEVDPSLWERPGLL